MDLDITEFRKNITKSSQIYQLDSIYFDFLRKSQEYDNDTIIPGLNNILKNIAITILLRSEIFPDIISDNYDNKKICLDIIESEEEISNSILIEKIYMLVDSISDYESDISIFKKVFNLKSSGNRYFFYPIVSKGGSFSLKDISECLIGYKTDNKITPTFSRVLFGVPVNSKLTSGPHNGIYDSPLSFLHHDLGHVNGILKTLDSFDLDIYRNIYSKILESNSHDKNFIIDIFYFITWYTIFERHYSTNITKLLTEGDYIYFDQYDTDYIIKYLKRYSPENISSFEINYKDRGWVMVSSDFFQLCIDYFKEFLLKYGIN